MFSNIQKPTLYIFECAQCAADNAALLVSSTPPQNEASLDLTRLVRAASWTW